MSELNFGEYVYDYDQEKWHDLPDGSYVAVKDIPAIVATELERLAERWTTRPYIPIDVVEDRIKELKGE